MDQDTREAFATLSGQLAGIRDDAHTAAERSTEAAQGVRKLTTRVEGLERAVFGSDPPPAMPAPLVKRLSDGELEQDALAARVIRIEAGMAEQTQMLTAIYKAVVGVTTNPLVQRAAKLVLLALIGWLTLKQPQVAAMLPQVLR